MMLLSRRLIFLFIFYFFYASTQASSEESNSPAIARIDSLNKLSASVEGPRDPLALELAYQALRESRSSNYVKGMADSYYNIGNYFYYSLEDDSALYYFNLSSNIADVVNYRLRRAKCEYRIGCILFRTNNHDDALYYARNAISTLRYMQDSVNLAKALNLVCEIYSSRGENEKAIDYCLNCIDLYEQLDRPVQKAIALNVIGNIYTQFKIYEKAEQHLREALTLAIQHNRPEHQSIAYNALAEMYFAKSDFKSALSNYQLAYDLDNVERDTIGLASSCFSVGKTYIELNRLDTAIHFLQQSLVLSDTLKDRNLKANTCAMLGKALHLKGKNKEALEFLNISLDIAKEINAYPILHLVHRVIAEYHEKSGQPEKALEYYRLFMDYDNKLRAEENARKIAEVDAIYELAQKEKRIEFLLKENEIQTLRARERELINKSLMALIFCTMIVAAVFYSRNRIKNKANRELEKQKEAIQRQKAEIEKQRDDIQQKSLALTEFNKQITYSIEYARRIQLSLFPSRDELKQIFPESFVFNKPKDIISGDFYWVATIENKIFLAVVDCTGHGVPGAFMTILASSLLNQIVLENRITCANMVLSLLDIKVKQNLHLDEHNPLIADGMDIGLCVIDKNERTIEYSGAKFNFYYVDGKNLVQVKGNRHPIGSMLFPEKNFSSTMIQLPPQTTCYLATDGFQDQFGGKQDTKFMKPKFKKLLKSMSPFPIDEQLALLADTFQLWKGNNQQTDDILVVGFKL